MLEEENGAVSSEAAPENYKEKTIFFAVSGVGDTLKTKRPSNLYFSVPGHIPIVLR